MPGFLLAALGNLAWHFRYYYSELSDERRKKEQSAGIAELLFCPGDRPFVPVLHRGYVHFVASYTGSLFSLSS